MLTSLQIRHYAIIDHAEIEFGRGMTVLTGETGAGKSILVDALGLVLGERGGTGLVRRGAQRAEFTAAFDLSDVSPAEQWLQDQALDLDGECHLRRVITPEGRSRAFINGNAVPLQSLKALGEKLLDIHGQHFHQSLGRRDVQRDLLDYFGELSDARARTAAAFGDWQCAASKLEELLTADADRASRIDLLRFQIGELEALSVQPGEPESLLEERRRLQHSDRLAGVVAAALQSLYDGDQSNAQTEISGALHSIESLAQIDSSLQSVADILREAEVQVSEAVDGLRRYADVLDMDPARRDWVEERLDAIHGTARKHRIEAAGLPELQADLGRQLDDLEHAEERSAELAAQVKHAEAAYRKSAEVLSAGRMQAAAVFSAQVSEAMSGLGMPGGAFEVAIRPRGRDDARASGIDDIEFMLTANPGLPIMPLSKVASGGELSRMSLAIQVIASDGSAIPTMVFDEVDSGVGGSTAEMVGLRLHELGNVRQVFCVTHLPQVASVADHHLRVIKISDGKTTKTGINELGESERIDELARMLGGVEITKRTREHAAEMLRKGAQRQRKHVPA